MVNRSHYALIFLAASGAIAGSAFARQPVDLAPARSVENRLDRVETALRDMQGVMYSSEQPNAVPTYGVPPVVDVSRAIPVSDAEMTVRITAVEQSLATLTGQIETLAYKLDRQQRMLDQMQATTGPEFGAPSTLPIPDGAGNILPAIPSGGMPSGAMLPAGTMPTGAMPTMPTTLPGANTGAPVDLSQEIGNTVMQVTLPDDPDAAYSQAYNAVLAADYALAEASLEEFVIRFPTSLQIADAKFLLGEVYLATGANGEAARIFLDHVGSYKEDPRAPEAYLKLGIAFARLDRTEEACKVFTAGTNKFTDLSQSLRRRYDSERGAAGCR